MVRSARESGQTAILFTLALIPVCGMLGLVVDIGWAYWRKEAAKTAAQSAVIGAAMAASTNTGLTCGLTVTCQTSTPCSSSPTLDPHDPTTNACLYAQANGFVNAGRQRVSVAADVTASPVAGVNPAYWVQATVSEDLPQLFSSILGHSLATVSATATSGVFLAPQGACIYALDPTASDAVVTVGTSNVSASCGVYVDSNNGTALEVKGGGVIDASTVRIVGNYSTSGGGSISPAPLSGQPTVPDPFAGVPSPNVPNRCDSNGITGDFPPANFTMPSDGMYVICNGGITLTGNNKQTFPSGMYIVQNGGITWNNGQVLGSNVTFYLTGPSYSGVSISGNVDVEISAPSSGTYRGLAFYQDRSLPTDAPASSFTGGSGQTINGSIYFPTTVVNYTGGSSTTASYTGVVARIVQFKGTSYLTADLSGIHTGLGLPQVALIQ